ncbi:hypothetical protein LTS10_009397 [Elasticomyces elasticus]|nr:hypothetical protein LTS10_009397 [Elasticomyces elasticus]
MDSSNSAHSFQPHHTIHIEYPCRDLYDQMLTPDEQASCAPVVWVPNNSQNRHNPSEPLVYDPAVAAHADGRDSQEETGFYSRTIANLVTPRRPEGVKVMRDLFDAKETSLDAMFRHVDAMSSRLGKTTLRVLLVDTLTPPVKTLVLILRTTRVISTTYDVYLNTSFYRDRKPILSETVKCALKYGIVDKGYVFDNRFSFIENMLRSIADLDHDLAEESDEPMWVDSEILISAYTQIVAVVALEPSTSTPFHL